MTYREKSEDGKWIYEPVLEKDMGQILFTSPVQIKVKNHLDLIFDYILKSGAQKGSLELKGFYKVEFTNNSKIWEEDYENNNGND